MSAPFDKLRDRSASGGQLQIAPLRKARLAMGVMAAGVGKRNQ